MSDAPPSGIALLAGPQLLGFFFDWALQGVLSVQIYFYYLLFPEDPLPTKILVYGTFVYEWVQTALITQTAFDIDVYQFGDRVSLTTYHNTWFSVTIMCAVISAVVQGYFAWRIYKFSCSGILAGVIIFLAFGQMCAGITGGILLKVMHSGAAAPSSSIITPVFTTWLTTAATVDVLIAVCMTYLLLRSKSGIRRSDAVVNRMVRLCIETGTLTASVAILNAVFFALPSQTLLYQCPALVLTQLYANTLLASLNNRAVFRRAIETSSDTLGGIEGVPNASSILRFHARHSTGTSSHGNVLDLRPAEDFAPLDAHLQSGKHEEATLGLAHLEPA